MPGLHVVTLGGSAGAIEALVKIVAGLPADFPAAVCVVVHQSPHRPSTLPHILRRAGPLPAFHAANGERVAPARIYVAPPDYHLVFLNGETRIVQGPRENGMRPAIDVLFRSAAQTYDAWTIGVLVSGLLDDGTAGLAAIRSRGGTTIAQDPGDALFPDMPRNAIVNAGPDFVLTADGIAEQLAELVRTAPANGHRTIHAVEPTGTGAEDMPRGDPSSFVCPQCGGTLFEVEDTSGPPRFRCRVGHAYAAETLYGEQTETLEAALWTALRTLEEQADLSMRLARRARTQQLDRSADRLESRAKDAVRNAETVRAALMKQDANGAEIEDGFDEIFTSDNPEPSAG